MNLFITVYYFRMANPLRPGGFPIVGLIEINSSISDDSLEVIEIVPSQQVAQEQARPNVNNLPSLEIIENESNTEEIQNNPTNRLMIN